MLVLITTFKNMVVKFIGGCSVATCSYVIITVLAVYVVLPLQELLGKKYKTLVLRQLI